MYARDNNNNKSPTNMFFVALRIEKATFCLIVCSRRFAYFNRYESFPFAISILIEPLVVKGQFILLLFFSHFYGYLVFFDFICAI